MGQQFPLTRQQGKILRHRFAKADTVVQTDARAAYTRSAPIRDQAATSEATSAAIRSLFAVVERYPDIKAGANVLDLQDEIERLEGMIADRRALYND